MPAVPVSYAYAWDTAARVSFPFFLIIGHDRDTARRGKKIIINKNPNLKRCVLRASLAPKISLFSLLLSVSLYHADILCLFFFGRALLPSSSFSSAKYALTYFTVFPFCSLVNWVLGKFFFLALNI